MSDAEPFRQSSTNSKDYLLLTRLLEDHILSSWSKKNYCVQMSTKTTANSNGLIDIQSTTSIETWIFYYKIILYT
jgi:hypothetical protein